MQGHVPRPRLPSKLERPSLAPALVRRVALVERLRHSTAYPLVVLTAGPGYGKTTLLTQWDTADGRPFSWIRLDVADRDPAVLLMYLARVLVPGKGADADVLEGPIDDPGFLAKVALPRLAQVMRNRDGPFVLVLDDIDVLECAAWDVVRFLRQEMPAGCQLVLSGRSVPEIALGSLVTHRRVLHLAGPELAMSVDEGRAVLSEAGVVVDEAGAAALVRRTEGWPASLYLAALSLRGSPHPDRAARSFSGADRLVTAYVRDELLLPAGDELRRFLLRTSILATMSGPLCDAVVGTSDSASVLAEISRTNPLLVPVEQDRYRYHRLFGEVLRAELARLEPDLVVELHRRASLAYERAGQPDEAISHAHAAGDERRAAELVWREVAGRLMSGRSAVLERWLAGFAGTRMVRDPLLALTAAACALAAGRPVTEWLVTAQHAADRPSPDSRSGSDVALAIAVFHAVMGRRGAVRMAADAETIGALSPIGTSPAALAHFFRGVAADLVGDACLARRQLRAGVIAAGRAALPTLQALCLAYLADLAYRCGDWRRTSLLAARARGLMEAAHAEDFITMASVHATVALALASERRAGEARRAATDALRLLAAVAPIAPWLDVHTRSVLARAHLLLGDPVAARMLLAEAQQVVELVPDAPELRNQLDEVWELVQARPLSMAVGPSSITPAELRVLRLLPTHLSFADISDQLFLTRNTIKTQAIAAYRKLGVSSRSEAVAQARMLGLIPSGPDTSGAGGAPEAADPDAADPDAADPDADGPEVAGTFGRRAPR